MKILVIDNYDSFTFNLVYILRKENIEVDVFRNDRIEAENCLQYDGIVLSPGPGIPKDAGNLTTIISDTSGKVPMLGVCLGHQAIGIQRGARVLMASGPPGQTSPAQRPEPDRGSTPTAHLRITAFRRRRLGNATTCDC